MVAVTKAQYIKKRMYVYKNNFNDSIVTISLMSTWQRLSGSGLGPQSGARDPRAWQPMCMTISDPPKVFPYFAHCLTASFSITIIRLNGKIMSVCTILVSFDMCSLWENLYSHLEAIIPSNTIIQIFSLSQCRDGLFKSRVLASRSLEASWHVSSDSKFLALHVKSLQVLAETVLVYQNPAKCTEIKDKFHTFSEDNVPGPHIWVKLWCPSARPTQPCFPVW